MQYMPLGINMRPLQRFGTLASGETRHRFPGFRTVLPPREDIAQRGHHDRVGRPAEQTFAIAVPALDAPFGVERHAGCGHTLEEFFELLVCGLKVDHRLSLQEQLTIGDLVPSLAKLFRAVRQFLLHVQDTPGNVQSSGELRGVQGLDEEIVGARLQAVQAVLTRSPGGQEDDIDVGTPRRARVCGGTARRRRPLASSSR